MPPNAKNRDDRPWRRCRPGRGARTRWRRCLELLALFCLALPTTADAQARLADEPGSIPARVQHLLNPSVQHLPGEARVLRSDQLRPACGTDAGRRAALRWLTNRGVAVLDAEAPGLELNYYAQGIEKMTRADRLWEGLPRRADSLQMLIDDAITRARHSKRPIDRLVIIGHAGLPGCAALGGTIDDCVFKGRLSPYHRRQLVRLRPYLAEDSEIELRQCVTGRGEEGQALLTALHRVTGAAASSYLADFHFGDSAAHPRIRVDQAGVRLLSPGKQ